MWSLAETQIVAHPCAASNCSRPVHQECNMALQRFDLGLSLALDRLQARLDRRPYDAPALRIAKALLERNVRTYGAQKASAA